MSKKKAGDEAFANGSQRSGLRGMTQIDLAEALGTTQRAVVRVINSLSGLRNTLSTFGRVILRFEQRAPTATSDLIYFSPQILKARDRAVIENVAELRV